MKQMTCLLLFISLMFSCSLLATGYSQKLETLKKSDTIYIYFDHGKGQEKFYTPTKNIGENKNPVYYIYFKENQFSFLSFGHMEFDHPEVRTVKKSFLKRNKNKIVNAAFLRQFDLKESSGIFGGKKKVYIIDTDDMKDNKIILREVRTGSTEVSEM